MADLEMTDQSKMTLTDSQSRMGRPSTATGRGLRFWMVFLTLNIAFFMALLENTAVTTALPTISASLHATQFVWIGSAYGLASMAFLPLTGGLAQIFGRRPVFVGSLVFFAFGSALAGPARNFGWLIAARTLQGVGAGGIFAVAPIIISDLVALHERGSFNGILGLSWCIAGGIAPIVGGSLAQEGQWRWLFYLNIPICGLTILLATVFLQLPTPPGTMLEKTKRIDWIGNCIVVSASCACVIALTWGGVQFSWSSPRVLVPLCLGLLGLTSFIVFERTLSKEPMVPAILLQNRTSLSGYIQTTILAMLLAALLYYLPVYYQACADASPTRSGVDLFGLSFTVAPFTIISGVSVTLTKRYRPQIWIGWCLTMIGLGLLSTLTANSSKAASVGFQILAGAGIGLIYSTLYFPVLAPLPVTVNAQALAFSVFARTFGQVWGVTIGSTVLQNELKNRLPSSFVALFPQGAAIAYAAIPSIPTLTSPLKDEVRASFAGSLSVVWEVMLGLSGLGLLSSVFMRGLPLHTERDDDWKLEGPVTQKSEQ